ncbi:hypothetical protein MJO29_014683 [Puccinia striiformis f. sp. tritici]|nr:hypothetical protein MJO29_014683 [Puccinia striiformis f. sp. tritici]
MVYSDPVELSDFETAKEESSGTNDGGSSNENESESSDNEEAEVANSLTPPSRILRERTSKLFNSLSQLACDAISSSNSDSDQDFASSLVPTQLNPSTRVLRERTSAIKPVKYSHLTTNCERKSSSSKPDDPKTFKSAMKHIDKRSDLLKIPQLESSEFRSQPK